MRTRAVFYSIILIVFPSIIYCQDDKELKLGSLVPDYIFSNLINYPKKSEQLSSFRGKLVILDFWNTTCASCIESWPKLLKLQEEFAADIQIILINTTQDEFVVKGIIGKREQQLGYRMTLPSVCKDTVLKHLFPHSTIPHVVWIDKTGRLRSITSGTELNSQSIQAAINRENFDMRQKNDFKYDVEVGRPLFINGNGGHGEKLLWQSVVSSYFDGFIATASIQDNYGVISNSTVLYMLRYLLGRGTNRFGAIDLIPISCVDLDVIDADKYKVEIDGAIQYQNLYSYQLFSKQSLKLARIKAMMLADVRRYFGVDFRWKKMTKKCLVFSALDTMKITYVSGPTKHLMNDVKFEFNNVTVSEVIQYMYAATKYANSPYPILNETLFKGRLGSVSGEADINNYVSLSRALEKYGIRITLEDREVNVLVVKDDLLDGDNIETDVDQ